MDSVVIDVVAPSHLHVSILSRLPILSVLSTVHSLRMHSFVGLPPSSSLALSTASRCRREGRRRGRGGDEPGPVWMLGDYRFGNYAAPERSEAACRTLNVSREMCNRNDGEMVRAAVGALEGLDGDGGRGAPEEGAVRVLAWDLAVREASGSDWFGEHGGSSEQLGRRFDGCGGVRMIELHEALERAGHGSVLDLVSDRGGHPTLEGLRFIVDELVWEGKPPPPPSLLRLLLNGRNLCRAALMLYSRAVASAIVPLQRRLAVVRPRRKYRGSSIRLLLAARLTNAYQLHLWWVTHFSLLVEVGVVKWWSGYSGYKLSWLMIFGWDGFDALSPPLLTR